MADSASQTETLIATLSLEEARAVLTEIARLSHSLDRLVLESVSGILHDRAVHVPRAVPSSSAAPSVASTVVAAADANTSQPQPPPAPNDTGAPSGGWGKDKTWAALTSSGSSAEGAVTSARLAIRSSSASSSALRALRSASDRPCACSLLASSSHGGAAPTSFLLD